jgi:anti-sigma B factor antagonist
MDDYGLTIEVRQEPGHMLVTVTGEVDIATAPQLRERIAAPAASGRPLIVDLNRVTFIDAAGLGVLASAARRAAARGASLHAVCARHQVQRLFTITGLDRQIQLARTVTEACQNLAAAQEIRVNGQREHAPREGESRKQTHGRRNDMTGSDEADLIVRNARVTTLQGPEAGAFAVRGEKFAAVGSDADVMRMRGGGTRVVDAVGAGWSPHHLVHARLGLAGGRVGPGHKHVTCRMRAQTGVSTHVVRGHCMIGMSHGKEKLGHAYISRGEAAP